MSASPYNDAPALTDYVIGNYKHLMTGDEKRSWYSLLHPTDGLKLALHLERVRNRILADHANDIVLNRCEKCGCLCRTPEACLCPVCNHTWYERRKG
jgi:hypothetical protein